MYRSGDSREFYILINNANITVIYTAQNSIGIDKSGRKEAIRLKGLRGELTTGTGERSWMR